MRSLHWLPQAAAHPLRETRSCRPGSRVSREWYGVLAISRSRDFRHAKQLVAAFWGWVNRSISQKETISMRTKLLAATALAGSLAIASVVWGSAQAVPGPTATQAPNKGIVTLVGNEGVGRWRWWWRGRWWWPRRRRWRGRWWRPRRRHERRWRWRRWTSWSSGPRWRRWP